MEVAHRTGGVQGAARWPAGAPGKQFDPNLVEILCADADKVFHDLDETESWDIVLDAEPAPSAALSPAECDEALVAISRFVDLKSPYTLGHSVAVAELVAGAATALGAPDSEVALVRRSALVSRYGCLGVSNGVWDKRRPLSPSDWERIRLHPYLTERMLQRSPALARLAVVAVQLRERLDGSGYPARSHGSVDPATGPATRRRRRVPGDARTSTTPAGTHPRRRSRRSSAAKPAPVGSTVRRSKPSSASPVTQWRGASNDRPASPAARSRSSDSSHAVVRTRMWPRAS